MLRKRRHLAETSSSELVGGCIMTNSTCWLQTNHLSAALHGASQMHEASRNFSFHHCVVWPARLSCINLTFPPLAPPAGGQTAVRISRPVTCRQPERLKKNKTWRQHTPKCLWPRPTDRGLVSFFLLFSLTPVSASVSSLVSQYITTVISAREVYIYTTLLPLLPVLNVYLPVGWLFLSSVLHLTSLIYTKRTH